MKMTDKQVIEEIRDNFITSKKNCFDCKFCTNVVGSAHKSCNHSLLISDLKQLILLSQVQGKFYKNPTTVLVNDVPLQDWDEVGIKNGWVLYPYNFDPVWLNYCLLFEEKN